MGTLKQKLDYIKETKRLIGEAITGKGGSVTDNFREYATAITNLPSGGGSCTAGVCFDDAGYDFNEPCLVKMRNDLNYTKQKYDEWDPSTDWAGDLYKNDKKLVYTPKIDTSKVTYMGSMFSDCTSLTLVPLFDTSKVTDMGYMFNNCSLNSVPLFDTSQVTDMGSMFENCYSLNSVPLFDTSKVTNMGAMFSNCKNLKEIPSFNTELVINFSYFNGYEGIETLIKINSLSLKSATNLSKTFSAWSVSPVQYMLLKDLGTPESVTEYNFSKQANWGKEGMRLGVDCTGASQTVVDSLLTYSFDRKTAGYPVCNFRCHTNMKQYLTEEQITAIQNKGYTITFG